MILLISTLISTIYFSCRKELQSSNSVINTPNSKFNFNALRPEIRVDTKDVLAWVAQNIPAADQQDLQLANMQQRYIDKHHVVKIPLKNKDHVALFFTKDQAQLKAF